MVALQQLPQLPELIRVGRYGPAGQVKGVAVIIAFLEFCEVKAREGICERHGCIDCAMQGRYVQLQFAVVVCRMLQPLLAMGLSMASFIDDNAAPLR